MVVLGSQRGPGVELTPGVFSGIQRVPSGLFLPNIPLHQFSTHSEVFRKSRFFDPRDPQNGRFGVVFGAQRGPGVESTPGVFSGS